MKLIFMSSNNNKNREFIFFVFLWAVNVIEGKYRDSFMSCIVTTNGNNKSGNNENFNDLCMLKPLNHPIYQFFCLCVQLALATMAHVLLTVCMCVCVLECCSLYVCHLIQNLKSNRIIEYAIHNALSSSQKNQT